MRFGIALGSNLGDRLQHLREAVRRLEDASPAGRVIACAPVFRTAPVDCPEGSEEFFNSALEWEENIVPLDLLDRLLQIEALLGRDRTLGWHAPRPIDLDVLYADHLTVNHPRLVLPHPRLTQRRFVLEPLSQVCPDRILPGQHHTIAQLLAALDSGEPPLQVVARDWR